MFDKVIMNPAYKGSLHLKILETVIKNCPKAEIVSLQPINKWQQEVLHKRPFSIRASSIDFVPRLTMCSAFSIGIRNDCGIINIGTNSSDDYSKFEGIVPNLQTRRKLLSHYDLNYTNFTERQPEEFALRMFIGCNRDAGHGWTVCPKSKEAAFSKHKAGNIGWLNFKTEAERNNCYDYMCSKFVKWVCKVTQSEFTPFLGDYTHPWADKDLYDKFGLTDEEIREIECSIKK